MSDHNIEETEGRYHDGAHYNTAGELRNFADGINKDGSQNVAIQPSNLVAYGSINTATAKTESGITFEDDTIAAATVETAGMSITLPNGTRKLRIWTDADANYISLWVGGAADVGCQIPIPGASTWFEIDFDFSTLNAQVNNANVVYITYAGALGAKTLILNAFARVV